MNWPTLTYNVSRGRTAVTSQENRHKCRTEMERRIACCIANPEEEAHQRRWLADMERGWQKEDAEFADQQSYVAERERVRAEIKAQDELRQRIKEPAFDGYHGYEEEWRMLPVAAYSNHDAKARYDR